MNALDQVSAKELEPVGKNRWLGLSTRLMVLTFAFVLMVEVMILLPSIGIYRNFWLESRLAEARTATVLLNEGEVSGISQEMSRRLLDKIGALEITLTQNGKRQLIAGSAHMPSTEDVLYPASVSLVDAAIQSLNLLVCNSSDQMRVADDKANPVEILLEVSALQQALRAFSWKMLLVSLFISLLTGALVYGLLHWMIVRPVRHLAAAFYRFRQDPEDATRILTPSSRRDELGNAERELAIMQHAIAEQFKKQQRLAMMGLAVAKINHDLRNMLAATQIWSDRLSMMEDPAVQRIAPKLIGSIDRAIAFCQNSLAYGRAMEPPPALKTFNLSETVTELPDLLAMPEDGSIHFEQDMPDSMMITADPDQIFRVLLNLTRNAVEAMVQSGTSPQKPARLTVAARFVDGMVEIDVADTGPGIPEELRNRLFQAFTSHARRGGTGLGLAIAAELMRAHGGSLSLQPSAVGSCFRMRLPQES